MDTMDTYVMPEDVKFFLSYLDERTTCSVHINGIVPHGEGVVILFTETRDSTHEYARCAGFELIEFTRSSEKTTSDACHREWRCKFNMIVSNA